MQGRRGLIWNAITVPLLVLLALEVVGCHRQSESSEPGAEAGLAVLRVVPRGNKDKADLSADDIIRVMQRTGFSDDQIIQLGPALRHALLQAGSAGIFWGKVPEAVFTVNGGYLIIQMDTRRTFVYDLANARFSPVPPSPGSGR